MVSVWLFDSMESNRDMYTDATIESYRLFWVTSFAWLFDTIEANHIMCTDVTPSSIMLKYQI
jgi:hypothetical protein